MYRDYVFSSYLRLGDANEKFERLLIMLMKDLKTYIHESIFEYYTGKIGEFLIESGAGRLILEWLLQ